MKKLIFKSLFLALAVVALSACRKEKEEEIVDKDTAGAEDNAFAENVSSDIEVIGSQAADGNSLSSFRVTDASAVLSSCATVTVDTVLHIITVTFNGGNCLDGRTRSGVLTF